MLVYPKVNNIRGQISYSQVDKNEISGILRPHLGD